MIEIILLGILIRIFLLAWLILIGVLFHEIGHWIALKISLGWKEDIPINITFKEITVGTINQITKLNPSTQYYIFFAGIVSGAGAILIGTFSTKLYLIGLIALIINLICSSSDIKQIWRLTKNGFAST